MNLQQIKEAHKWCNHCPFDVQSTGELYITTHGLAQKIEVVDITGVSGTIVVYCMDETFAVEHTGEQYYRAKYKSGGYVGYPEEPKELNSRSKLMKAPPQETKQRDLPPAGTQLAICYHVVDLGTHKKVYQTQEKNVRLLKLGWELPECRHQFETKEGEKVDKPFAIWSEYTFSTYVKANLSMLIVPWMGECPENFDFESLIGKGCYLSIVHEVANNGNTYANVKGAMALPPAIELPLMFNEPQFYDLTGMGKDFPAWLKEEKMSWLKEKIESCQEFAQIDHASEVLTEKAESLTEPQGNPIDDSDLPF